MPPASTPPPASRPWWLAALVIAIGGICILGASTLPPPSRYAGIGPGTVPRVIGFVLIGLGVVLAIQIARGETFKAQGAEYADADAPMSLRAFLLALAAAALPIVTLRSLGLPLVAMVSFTLVARAFGSRRLLLDLVTGAILGGMSWLLFDRLGLQLGGFMPFAGF